MSRLCVQMPILWCVSSARVKTQDDGSICGLDTLLPVILLFYVCVFLRFLGQTVSPLSYKHSASLCDPYIFDFIVSSKMLDREDDINDQITFRHLHSNVSSSPEYKSTPITHPPRSCLYSPGKLCISALGGKHYTGLAQGSVALDIFSWPLATILLMARVSSSTFIRACSEGALRERELLLHL